MKVTTTGPGPVPGPINSSEDPKIISDPLQRVKARIIILTDSFCPCDACLKDLASLIKEIKSTPSLNAARLLNSDFKELLSKLDVIGKLYTKDIEAITGKPYTPLNPESSTSPVKLNDLKIIPNLVDSLITNTENLQKLDGTLDPTLFQDLANKQEQLLGPSAKEIRSSKMSLEISPK